MGVPFVSKRFSAWRTFRRYCIIINFDAIIIYLTGISVFMYRRIVLTKESVGLLIREIHCTWHLQGCQKLGFFSEYSDI